MNSKFLNVSTNVLNEVSQRVKSLMEMLAVASLISAIAAGCALGFGIWFYTDAKIIAIGIALCIGYVLYINHRSLVHDLKISTIMTLLVISVILSSTVALPMKFMQSESYYTEKYVSTNEELYQGAEVYANDLVGIIENERKEINANIQKAGEQFGDNRQALIEARRIKKEFLEGYEARVLKAEQTAVRKAISENGYQQELDMSRMAVFNFFIRYTYAGEGDSGDKTTFWITFFIFFFVEASPSLVALALLGTSYVDRLKHDEKVRSMVIKKRNDSEIQMLEGDDDIPKNLARRGIAKALIDAFRNDFRDTSEILRQYQLLHNLEHGVLSSTTQTTQLDSNLATEKKKKLVDDNEIPLFNYEDDNS